jgi:hypothetical protein
MQSLPLLRLPIMLGATPGTRQWSYERALVDLRLARFSGAPGDVEVALYDRVASAGRPLSGGAGGVRDAAAAAAVKSGHEDLPGVPAEAWVRVSRGVLPSEPYTPGETARRLLRQAMELACQVCGSCAASSAASPCATGRRWHQCGR